MTDKQKLQQIQQKLAANEYFRHNVLKDLINQIDEKTGKLYQELNIPQNERDELYLWDILMINLEYKVLEKTEEYNGYHECYCYKIKIC